jgi:hypothetical protein
MQACAALFPGGGQALHACMLRSFCRECIEGALGAAAGGYRCPCCGGEGRQTLLGANPWASGRLQPDFVLDALIRKMLPEGVRQHLIWQRVQVPHGAPSGPCNDLLQPRTSLQDLSCPACMPCEAAGTAAGAGTGTPFSLAAACGQGATGRMRHARVTCTRVQHREGEEKCAARSLCRTSAACRGARSQCCAPTAPRCRSAPYQNQRRCSSTCTRSRCSSYHCHRRPCL